MILISDGTSESEKFTYETLIAQFNPVLLYIDNLNCFEQEGITVQKQFLVFLWYMANLIVC